MAPSCPAAGTPHLHRCCVEALLLPSVQAAELAGDRPKIFKPPVDTQLSRLLATPDPVLASHQWTLLWGLAWLTSPRPLGGASWS